MITTGVPVMDSQPSQGPFSTDAAANAIKQIVEPSSVSVSAVVSSFLATSVENVLLMVETVNSTVGAMPEIMWEASTVQEALYAIGDKKAILRPVPGQTGRALEWEWTGTEYLTLDAPLKAAIDAIIAPAPPKYTVGQLIQKIGATMPENAQAALVIRQSAGVVDIYQEDSGTITEVAPLPATWETSQGALVKLEATAATPTADAPIFEGGKFLAS